MAMEEKRAVIRVRVDREESKIARVAEMDPGAVGRGFCDGVWASSGNDIDGKEESRDVTSSHFCESSAVFCCECEALDGGVNVSKGADWITEC